MSKKKYIVANWKMNFTTHEASVFVHKLTGAVKAHNDVEVIVAPSMLSLQSIGLQIDHKTFKLACQNMYWRDFGAYTGEVSAHQLRGLVSYAILGHSERRHIFSERGKDIGYKVQAAIRNHIKPILCVGETTTERLDGETGAVIHDQLVSGLHGLTSDDMENVVIAYEPVWAISNGKDFSEHKTPTPHDISDAQDIIRRQIEHLFGRKISREVTILYGGSVSSHNAAAYMGVKGIDGLLIGGASLKVEEFSSIIEIAHGLQRKSNK